MKSDEMPMMACGHRANSLGTPAGGGEQRPACVICSCFIVSSWQPELSGRRARCDHYGRATHGSECNYGGDRDNVCYCEQPSDGPLAFFSYLGPGSFSAVAVCECGLYEKPHRQPWNVVVMVDRNWFKCGRIEMKVEHTLYADTKETAEVEAEAERIRRIKWDGPNGGKEETRIFGARIASLEPIRRTAKCKEFRPRGPSTYDSFYCGCHGWD